LVVIFADKLAYIFSYSSDAQHLSGKIVTFLRIQTLSLPFVPLGMFTSSMFKGVRKGKLSLIVTIIRTIIFQVAFVLLLGKVFNLGLVGVLWGIVGANILPGLSTFLWGKNFIKNLDLIDSGNC